MYAHTVKRLRAAGVRNAVFVMVYMSYEPWCVQPWFSDLWPGDDVVDWVGFDPYLFAKPGGYGYGDFGYLVNRTSDPKRWPGFYTWVTRTHGNKPLMVAEWGVFDNSPNPSNKAWIFSTVASQIGRFPALKALVYFDSPAAPKGDTRPDSSSPALQEYRRLAESAIFTVHVG
jgi:beta-mannanase